MNPQDQILIEKYFNSKLSKEENTLFEKRMTDSQFAQEFNFQQDLQVAFTEQGRTQLRAEFQELDSQLSPESLEPLETAVSSERFPTRKKPSKLIQMLRPLVAAAALLTLLAGGWWFFQNTQANPEQLYTSYFEPYPNIVALVDRSGDDPTTMQEAMVLYTNQEYDQAFTALTELIEKGNNSNLLFYKGIILLEQGKASNAIQIFKKINLIQKSQFQQPAQWYLALSYLKSGDQANAKNKLQEILNDPNHVYFKEAGELLEKI